MSRIPLKYHTNVLFYTKYTHPTLICSGTDGHTDGQTEIFTQYSGISSYSQGSTNIKHVHTFASLVFALQNALASGKLLPRWSPCARLGLDLGPSPTHARNVYLVLNVRTGCVSPQYHCRTDDFFEMTHHGRPDVSDTICWQQLAGLSCAAQILSDLARPTQSSMVS